MDEQRTYENYLSHRHRHEAAHYDRRAREGNRYWVYDSGIIDYLYPYIVSLLGELRGKTVIDFGCGAGSKAVDLAKRGAFVRGFDVSEGMLKRARQLAVTEGVADWTDFRKMPAEATNYESCCGDIALSSGAFHHFDIRLARDEMYRVLKPGGRALLVEPLAHNPLLNFYRYHISSYPPTAQERAFLLTDIEFISRQFKLVRQEFFYLVSLFALLFYRFFKSKRLFLSILEVLMGFDSWLLRAFPFLKKYCWITVVLLEK
jgi:ubiquinone/menaquinone biosynthesis C-methylase UbiE